jgi:RNA polymerase sigma-70 factor (ECF subfamily)
MPPPSESAQWFADEVQPHEPVLRAWLRGSFPAVREVDDVVQESYLRLWRARAAQPVRSARAFLFRVAHRVALDVLRHRRSAPFVPVDDEACLRVADEAADARDHALRAERVAALAAALEALPARQRAAVTLCRLEGLSYREAAARLGVAEKTVAEQVYRGVQRLGVELQRRGAEEFAA